jgi:phosphoglycerate dehydrogenase-like enzyme
MTLAGLRSLIRYDREVRRGGFRKSYTAAPTDSRGLYGRTVGLIGFGRTARDFIRLLQPFGCEILAFDPHAEPSVLAAAGARPATLEEVLGTSDVVSLHAAYTPETHHLLNAERLAMLKDGALLVNTARGALVDETALAAQLRTGRIAAGLDVTVVEPLPCGAELTALPNVILTPHIGGPTYERLPELGRSAVEDLRIFFAGGRPPNLITPQMLATMA